MRSLLFTSVWSYLRMCSLRDAGISSFAASYIFNLLVQNTTTIVEYVSNRISCESNTDIPFTVMNSLHCRFPHPVAIDPRVEAWVANMALVEEIEYVPLSVRLTCGSLRKSS